MSRWTPVTRDIPQGSLFGKIQFNIFISDTVSGITCTISKSAGDTKLSAADNTPERWNTIQRNLDKLEKRAPGKLMRFNKANCKVMYLDQGNLWYKGCRMKGLQGDLWRRTWGYWWRKSWA